MRDSGRVDTSRGVTCHVSPARCALGPVVITGDIYAAPLTLGALLGHIVDRATLGDTSTPLTLTLSAGWGSSSSTFTLALTCHVSRVTTQRANKNNFRSNPITILLHTPSAFYREGVTLTTLTTYANKT